MLISIGDLQLKSKRDIRIIPDMFSQRITGNYGWMFMKIAPEDLIHLVMEIPQSPENLEGAVNIQTHVHNNWNSLTTLISQMINRLSFTQTSFFSYSDIVYVENILRKIGVQNPTEFIRQVQQAKQAEQLLRKLQILYRNKESSRQERKNWIQINGKDSDIREYQEQKKEIQRKYFLQNAIFRRLQTANLIHKLEKINQTKESSRLDWQQMQLTELSQYGNLIRLEAEQEDGWILEGKSYYEIKNPYEYRKEQHQNITRQSIYSQMAAAVLFYFTSKYLYEKQGAKVLKYQHGMEVCGLKWLEITEKACSSASVTLERFWIYHREEGYEQDFTESWQKKAYERYHKEVICIELLKQENHEGIKNFLQTELIKYQEEVKNTEIQNTDQIDAERKLSVRKRKTLSEELEARKEKEWKQHLDPQLHQEQTPISLEWEHKNEKQEIVKQEIVKQESINRELENEMRKTLNRNVEWNHQEQELGNREVGTEHFGQKTVSPEGDGQHRIQEMVRLEGDEKHQQQETVRLEGDEKHQIQEIVSQEVNGKHQQQETVSLEVNGKHHRQEIINLEANVKHQQQETLRFEADVKHQQQETLRFEGDVRHQIQETVSLEEDVRHQIQETVSLEGDVRHQIQETVSLEADVRHQIQETVSLEEDVRNQIQETVSLEEDVRHQIQETVSLEEDVRHQKQETVGLEEDVKQQKQETLSLKMDEKNQKRNRNSRVRQKQKINKVNVIFKKENLKEKYLIPIAKKIIMEYLETVKENKIQKQEVQKGKEKEFKKTESFQIEEKIKKLTGVSNKSKYYEEIIQQEQIEKEQELTYRQSEPSRRITADENQNETELNAIAKEFQKEQQNSTQDRTEISYPKGQQNQRKVHNHTEEWNQTETNIQKEKESVEKVKQELEQLKKTEGLQQNRKNEVSEPFEWEIGGYYLEGENSEERPADIKDTQVNLVKNTELKKCLDRINEENVRRYEIWKKQSSQEETIIHKYGADTEKIRSQAVNILSQERADEKLLVSSIAEKEKESGKELEKLWKTFSVLREKVDTKQEDIVKIYAEFHNNQREEQRGELLEQAVGQSHVKKIEKEKLGLVYRETIQKMMAQQEGEASGRQSQDNKKNKYTEVQNTISQEQQFLKHAKMWKQELIKEQSEKLERIVEQKVQQNIHQQVNELTDKVYGKLERRLKGEKKRRGY